MKILRAIARLFVVGAVGAGALFAAVKVGPRVVSKLSGVLRRTPPADADGEFDQFLTVPPGAAGASRAEDPEPPGTADPTPTAHPSAEHAEPEGTPE